MMYRFTFSLGCLFLVFACAWLPVWGAEPQQDTNRTKLSPLMMLKLERSKAILEGLTLEDYDKIAKNARALKLLSLESGWNVIQTEKYASQSEDFRRACDLISEAAQEKDVSRATLGYLALTVRCVECHSYMRKNKIELSSLKGVGSPHGDALSR